MINGVQMQSTPLPERLTEGRRSRGFTQSELAEAVGITKQAISQYETGSNNPKPEIFEAIRTVLEIPYGFFYKPIPYQLTTPIFFRKRRTAPKMNYEMFEVRIGWMIEIYQYVRQFVEFPETKLNQYTKDSYSFEDVIKIAGEVREFWGLGKGPISNVSLLLENNGFLVSKVKCGTSKVDACSWLKTDDGDKRPFVFSTPETSAVRSRRDFAHETGHQFMHSWMDRANFNANQKRLDDEAEWFASAFLVPPDAIRREGYAVTSLDSLLMLKKRWKVSAQSLLYFMRDLEVIKPNRFNYLSGQMYARRWRMSEPLDDELEQEDPQLINQAVTLMLENKVRTPEQFKDSIPFPVDDLEDLCGLERNALIHKQKPLLKVIK